MSKNLRSKKASEGATETREDRNESIQEFRILAASLTAKMDELTVASKNRHVDILNRLQRLEENSTTLRSDITELKTSVEFANSEVQNVKTSLAAKADQSLVDELVKRIDDLENRSKRNNIVIWNVPEDAGKQFFSCEALVKNIFFDFMGLDENVEVMRAHRTTVQNRRGGAIRARPIHVALLRFTDKQYILRNAAAKLKDHPFQEASLFILDDVSRKVREDRKKLKENHLDAIRAREDVEFAFIPWSVPARILFKNKDTDKLKSFSLIVSADTGEFGPGQG